MEGCFHQRLGRSNSTNPKSEFSPKRWLMDGFGLLAARDGLEPLHPDSC